MAFDIRRRWRHLDEEIEKRREVRPRIVGQARRRPELGIRVDDRELDLVLVRAEVHEQLVDLVEDLRRTRVGSVDLVDRDDDRQVAGHRLLEDVARLRQWTLGGVDEEQDRVDHEQRALHLAAEVGVTGRVDDVEADAGVVDGRLLGEDGDPLLALEITGVENPVDDGLVRPERAGLTEHRVDEGCLAVVDMGDDGEVAKVRPDRGRARRGRVEVARGGHGGAGDVGHGWRIVAHVPRNPVRAHRPARVGPLAAGAPGSPASIRA